MSTHHNLTIEYLRQCLRYENGRLFWLHRPQSHFKTVGAWKMRNTKDAGREAGYKGFIKKEWRWSIGICGVEIHRARLVWMLYHGYLPVLIDHANRNTLDDHIDNLRLASKSQNAANSKTPITNTSSAKGVSWKERDQKWRARITVRGKELFLGSYLSVEEAKAAYDAAARLHFGQFANTN